MLTILKTMRRGILVIYCFCVAALGHLKAVEGPESMSTVKADRLLLLAQQSEKKGQFTSALQYLDSVLAADKKISNPTRCKALMKKAFVLEVMSDYGSALHLLLEAQQLFSAMKDSTGLAETYTHMGAIHHYLEEYRKAAEFYEHSLAINKRMGQKKDLAICYNNFGALAEDMKEPYKALLYHRQSHTIWKAIGEKGWEGLSSMHMGICHQLLGQKDSAVYYLQNSIRFIDEKKDMRSQALVYNLLGNAYRSAGNFAEAKKWCSKGLALAENLKLVRYQAKGCECLAEVLEAEGKIKPALYYHKKFVALRDSALNEQKAKEITRIELNYGFRQKRLEDSLHQERATQQAKLSFEKNLAREKEKRNISIFTGILILGLAGGLWHRLRFVRRSRKLLASEKDRAENLLLRVLPSEIVEELKTHGRTEGREHENITVLFLDVKDFTSVAEQMTPKELVAEIHYCFERFDTIMEKYGLEKIKTIGDSYMAAAGVPAPIENGAVQTIFAALEIQQLLKTWKTGREQQGLPGFSMRAGIHTGPVVAGVVGVNKFQYDIWGDTVNTASRMETASEAGKVNISQTTYELAMHEPSLVFEFRGAIKAKGKGLLDMYFVNYRA